MPILFAADRPIPVTCFFVRKFGEVNLEPAHAALDLFYFHGVARLTLRHLNAIRPLLSVSVFALATSVANAALRQVVAQEL